jgi:iron complex outermembrane receptor protein
VAEGKAVIIYKRIKKYKRLGGNGSVNGTYSQGRYARLNGGGSGNYRNEWLNIFGTVGYMNSESYHDMDFLGFQNGLSLDEINNSRNARNNYNYRVGIDFFLEENHTVGFLITGQEQNGESRAFNRIEIAPITMPSLIDSILVARSLSEDNRIQNTYNINYRFDNKKSRTVNLDLDYGSYQNDSERFLRNRYYNAAEEVLLTQRVYAFDTPTDIDIYTATLDYEEDILGGKLSVGSKLSRVETDNTFLRSDVLNGISIQNDTLSNNFQYEENVYAGYINFSRAIGKKWNFSAGLRAEQTDASGDLQAFVENYEAEPVDFNYLSWFPSLGVTWQAAPKHSLALNYGRRINRPDYNVLNPFNNLISELSFEKGNPFLRPEIVNNVELGYTYNYMYNFKLAYSLTEDQITRLIAPDENDVRAGFITWDNLATQTVVSFNASAPVQISKVWNAYMNFSASYLDNQADYGEGAVVDVQAFTYNIYQQHTFNLPAGFKGEISGWFAGPGVWGGVFEYETSWSLDLGLQKRFLQDKLNVRLTVSDIFYQTGWDGISSFDGLTARGSGRWDSRRGTLSLSYNFGNQNVKSRKRKTGLEAEADRLGG